jgi:hypothetical protein
MMQIQKSSDYRVNELAEFIEHLQDIKYHIKPFEMATEIVVFMDNLRGKEYARKIQDYIKTQHNFDSKDKV